MAEFFVTIEGMWSSNGKWELIADRPDPIVPPKVTIKGRVCMSNMIFIKHKCMEKIEMRLCVVFLLISVYCFALL